MARTRPLTKFLILIAVLGLLGYLFMRSLQDVRSEPYIVRASQIGPWTLALEAGSTSTAPLLVLRPAQELAGDLFRQIFQRAMESLKGSTSTGIPVVLRGEYDRSLATSMTPEALLEAARAAGLESASVSPRCVATRRISLPGVTRQVYFAVFDAPALDAFRQQLAAAASMAGAVPFEPNVLSPILIIGASDDAFASWLPLKADPAADCLAPIQIQ